MTFDKLHRCLVQERKTRRLLYLNGSDTACSVRPQQEHNCPLLSTLHRQLRVWWFWAVAARTRVAHRRDLCWRLHRVERRRRRQHSRHNNSPDRRDGKIHVWSIWQSHHHARLWAFLRLFLFLGSHCWRRQGHRYYYHGNHLTNWWNRLDGNDPAPCPNDSNQKEKYANRIDPRQLEIRVLARRWQAKASQFAFQFVSGRCRICIHLLIQRFQNTRVNEPKNPRRSPYCGAFTPTPVPLRS